MARRFPAGTTIAVVAAIALAAAATWAIFSYVRGLEQRAFDGAELVEVFVAGDDIPIGITGRAAGDAGLIVREMRMRSSVPDGAIVSLDDVAGLVTEERILRDEVIVRGRFVDPDRAAIAFEIPADHEAIAVEVGVPPGVAGFVRAGDRVSLIATVERTSQVEPGTAVPDEAPDDAEVAVDDEADVDAEVTAAEASPAAPDTVVETRYLLQGIEVLAVGQRIVTESGEDGVAQPDARVLLTLALPAVDAERLVLAIDTSSLYVTLLPEDAQPQDTPGRTLDDLFD